MLLKGSQDHTCTIQSFIVFVMYFLIIKAKKKPVTVHGFIESNLKQIVSGKKRLHCETAIILSQCVCTASKTGLLS